MKKIYVKPTSTIESIAIENVMAAASPFKFDDNNGTGEGGVNDGDATGEGLGNSNGSLWDED